MAGPDAQHLADLKPRPAVRGTATRSARTCTPLKDTDGRLTAAPALDSTLLGELTFAPETVWVSAWSDTG